MIIKAGTYKFKNTLSSPAGSHSLALNYTTDLSVPLLSDIIHTTASCSQILVECVSDSYFYVQYYVDSTDPDESAALALLGTPIPSAVTVYDRTAGWNITMFGDDVRSITIPEDISVHDALGAWFVHNVEPSFNIVLTKLQLLVNKVNAVTGKFRADLASAIDTLLEEYLTAGGNTGGNVDRLFEQDQLLSSIETSLGIDSNPLAILSAEDFAAMKPDGVYYLVNDITIPASYGNFAGKLYGFNHTITTTSPVFTMLDNAEIYDLVIDGDINMPDTAAVGALAATATGVYAYNVTNNADVTAVDAVAGIVGRVSKHSSFVKCVNNGDMYSHRGWAAGIVAYAEIDATLERCINTGSIKLYDEVSSTTKQNLGAAGVVGWIGGIGIVRYCVNAGSVQSNMWASGIGGYFGGGHNVSGHIITGCVNIGHIHSSEKSVAGIVRRTYKLSTVTYNTIMGTVKSDASTASAVINYNVSASTNYNHNIVMLDKDDISGTDIYLIGAVLSANITVDDDVVANGYAKEGVFDNIFGFTGNINTKIPADYKYFYTDEDLYSVDSVHQKFSNAFTLANGVPVYMDVAETYNFVQEGE